MTLALSALTGARAAAAAPARGVDASAPPTSALPGALGHRRDPDALLDHRYLWDLEDNLLLQEAADRTSTYAYDAQDRLIVSATALKAIGYRHGKPIQSDWLERYEYVGDTRRPHLIARPSVVPGLEMRTRFQFNAHGQPLAVTESGWAPATGAGTAPQALSRTTHYGYTLVNGHSITDSRALIRYYRRKCGPLDSPAVGLVEMTKYSEWTKKFGITIAFQQPTQTRICQ